MRVKVADRDGLASEAALHGFAFCRCLSQPPSSIPCVSVKIGQPFVPATKPTWRNWQTRRTQNPVTARSCGFDPLRRHVLLVPGTLRCHRHEFLLMPRSCDSRASLLRRFAASPFRPCAPSPCRPFAVSPPRPSPLHAFRLAPRLGLQLK